VAAGLGVLVGGGKAFVTGAVGLALAWGMSERMVGLTIVAVGTSLPELAASLVAALRGHSELAVGNVVGSNIFNVLMILGVTGAVQPIVGSLDAMKIDMLAMVAFTFLCALSMRKGRRMTRVEGGAYVAAYAAFVAVVVAGG
jgi:cation:H+ antiporter